MKLSFRRCCQQEASKPSARHSARDLVAELQMRSATNSLYEDIVTADGIYGSNRLVKVTFPSIECQEKMLPLDMVGKSGPALLR